MERDKRQKTIFTRAYASQKNLLNEEREYIDNFMKNSENADKFLDFISLKTKNISAFQAYEQIFEGKKKIVTNKKEPIISESTFEKLTAADIKNPYYDPHLGVIIMHKFLDNLSIICKDFERFEQEITDLIIDSYFNDRLNAYRAVIKTLSDGFCNESYQKFHYDNNDDIVEIVNKVCDLCDITYSKMASIFNTTIREVLNNFTI